MILLFFFPFSPNTILRPKNKDCQVYDFLDPTISVREHYPLRHWINTSIRTFYLNVSTF